jgi:hypothetical protein
MVDATSMAAGIALSRWFSQEAKRVYGMLAEGQTDEHRRKLAERIERLGGTITAYELKRHARQYRSTDQAEAALQDLVDRGFGAWTAYSPGAHGGRAWRVFVLHGAAETPSKHEENGGYSNSNADGKEQPERGGQEGAWRRAAETPSKHEENGGYSNSNINTQREQDDDWGYV